MKQPRQPATRFLSFLRGRALYFATQIRRKMRHKSICIPFVHDKAR
nr:MAG TPA: hypothetical protein [Caudoviricetes sp.]DAY21058.1 MAG TPA: hypothetical protein [Caudoviricetes sp.]